jgi:hypothetical protein
VGREVFGVIDGGKGVLKMRRLLLIILLVVAAGCAPSATAYRDYLIDARFYGAISDEEYKAKMTPELLYNVAIEQTWDWRR